MVDLSHINKDIIINCEDCKLNIKDETVKAFIIETANNLKGAERRQYMAKTVCLLGKGGQTIAEMELGWNRVTITKGMREVKSGITCIDNFQGRGRKKAEEHLPGLLDHIKSIVHPTTQTDPTFRTTQLYTPLTAVEVHSRLLDMGFSVDELPTTRTILNKMNMLGFHLQKVEKSKPKKKIPETDAIFDKVHETNKLADESDGVLRISMDAKANINVGNFSRGGYNRQGEKAYDHDFEPDQILKLFGIFIPKTDESFFYFSKSNVTPDFMVDCLIDLWPDIRRRFNPHTLVINLDNGPENNSRRTQFIKRMVDFAKEKSIDINLTYYPPYHSKYNPIERVWGVLENHWIGQIFSSVEKVLGLARTMTWNKIHPIVKMVEGVYKKGVKLTKKAMQKYEDMIERLDYLTKWFVTIPFFKDCTV